MFGTKLLFVLNDNPSRGLDSHQGQVILADGETGQIRALLDASAVTGIRTAAVSALATRLLARGDASILAIVGTGIQARKHLESIPLVRTFSRALIAGRTRDHAQRFVDEVAAGAACPVAAAESVEDAVRAADVVVTVTDSPTPVMSREWLRPGTHVNAVGASRPWALEIDPKIYADAVVFAPEVLNLCVKVFGADNMMYGSDYPHTIGDLPGCLRRVNELPVVARDRVRGQTAQRIFGF